jgi:hypothetical protein
MPHIMPLTSSDRSSPGTGVGEEELAGEDLDEEAIRQFHPSCDEAPSSLTGILQRER